MFHGRWLYDKSQFEVHQRRLCHISMFLQSNRDDSINQSEYQGTEFLDQYGPKICTHGNEFQIIQPSWNIVIFTIKDDWNLVLYITNDLCRMKGSKGRIGRWR